MTSRMLAMEMVKKLGSHRCINSDGWPDSACGCLQSTGPIMKFNQGNGCHEMKQLLRVLKYLSDEEFDSIVGERDKTCDAGLVSILGQNRES